MNASVLVTGANRGIGLEMVRQLLERGSEVIATARKPEEARELGALDVPLLPLDVTSTASAEELGRSLAGRPLDVLVNNAGVGVGHEPFESLDVDALDRYFQVNCLGALRVTRALLPNLRAGGLRRVVQITSRMGSIADNGFGGSYGYRASKAALNMVTKSLSIDFGGEGFSCFVLHPGWVRTDMGGAGAPLGIEESVRGLLGVICDLERDVNGGFFDYSGEAVPW